jgi:hypothetical protein
MPAWVSTSRSALISIFAAGAAVVRMVQEGFDFVEGDLEAGAVRRFDLGAEMMEQRLDFAPVDIGARWILEDAAHQACVLVAHDRLPIIQVPSFYAARKITSGKDEF